ncbi:MAG: hypothetical protein HUJ26_14225 [Planctomycetaceae bacterium]|nr:hypothetical protein [Planctomycetaceae bacterium]
MRRSFSTIRLLCCCLVTGALWSVSLSEADASCGDYLFVKGKPIVRHEMPLEQDTAHQRSPQMPSPCLNGQCGVPPRTPSPSGTTSDVQRRVEVRPCSILETLADCSAERPVAFLNPTDQDAPSIPHPARLEKPPQITFL